ncbi:DUF3265 domain-containing protein [Vibrio parahaemolyticus]|nr:DUF3265 domain-containing protein [Vibrio parahaemolyticus]MCC4219417.1 DUF3265 domain-containing protein [Vibrio parahaemolyticus]MDF4766173.1 DUF3265 domain-containing protein [Vibrio parahaemolyticus]
MIKVVCGGLGIALLTP